MMTKAARSEPSASEIPIRERMARFVFDVWERSSRGYTFVAARDPDSRHWYEVAIQHGRRKSGLRKFLSQFSRENHDLYFCANAFAVPKRLKEHALPTPWGWCDIDDGDPRDFDPSPSILWKTSPGRYQGLWLWEFFEKPDKAEAYSEALAHHGGGDRNGWSITKMLRLPLSINHKPKYQEPTVTVVDCHWRAESNRPRIIKRSFGNPLSKVVALRPHLHTLQDVWKRYRSNLHPRTNALIMNKRAYSYERDRSKCIFEIIAGLYRAGATPDEIGAVLWANPYFLSKHGRDFSRLSAEIGRVISKLEAKK